VRAQLIIGAHARHSHPSVAQATLTSICFGLACSLFGTCTVSTPFEQNLALLVCDGRSNQEIADESGLSLETVKKHLHSIFCKLEVPSRSRLITLMR